MKLADIHLNYKTDKGVGHNYIETYDNLFGSIRLNKLNVLEIGVLLGGSLKMWEFYFENSMIYGIDDFSQVDTNVDFGNEKVNSEMVKKELFNHKRIEFIECDSRSAQQVQERIASLGVGFDVIIDDGEHSLPCQIDNFNNFFPLLNDGGVYVVEDCAVYTVEYLKNHCLSQIPDLKIDIVYLDIQRREDDVLMIIRK